MKATELIATGLQGAGGWMEALLADLDGRDAVAMPTSKGGNHALWVIGHVTLAEASLVNAYILGKEEPMKDEDYQLKFGGTKK